MKQVLVREDFKNDKINSKSHYSEKCSSLVDYSAVTTVEGMLNFCLCFHSVDYFLQEN